MFSSKKPLIRGLYFAALFAALLMARPASAQTVTPGLLTGFADDAMQPGKRAEASLTITSVGNGHFTGDMHIGVLPASIADTHVSAYTLTNTMISGYSLIASGPNLQFSGRLCASGSGLPPLGVFQYQVTEGAAVTHRGVIALLQNFGDAGWNRLSGAVVAGNWIGTSFSGLTPQHGTLTSQLANLPGTTAFIGTMTFAGVMLQLRGTVSPANGTSAVPCAAIGMDTRQGIIAVLIGLLLPAHAPGGSAERQGTYRQYNSLSDLYKEWTLGVTAVQDSGTWIEHVYL